MVDFLTETARLQPNVSAYRKGHSTTTTLLAIRDDMPKAMNRGEVTIAIMEDFSKAFDTVVYETSVQIAYAMVFQVLSTFYCELFE